MSNLPKEIKIKLTVSPSLNKLKGRWSGFNWKKKYLKELSGYELLAPKNLDRKVFLFVNRFGSRHLDKDNLYGGLKPMIDAIKEKKLIVDDRPEWLVLEATQTKCSRGEERCEIEIIYMFKVGRGFGMFATVE